MKTLKKPLLLVLTVALAALALASCGYHWLSLEEYAAELKAADDFSGGAALSGYDGAFGTVDYGFDLPENAELEQKYGLSRVAGEGGELQKTKNLLAWVSDHVDHNGSVGQVVEKDDAPHLLEYAFDQERGINCGMLAITLSECLRAVGIKSRPVYIMPKGANSGDNHVVTQSISTRFGNGSWSTRRITPVLRIRTAITSIVSSFARGSRTTRKF